MTKRQKGKGRKRKRSWHRSRHSAGVRGRRATGADLPSTGVEVETTAESGQPVQRGAGGRPRRVGN